VFSRSFPSTPGRIQARSVVFFNRVPPRLTLHESSFAERYRMEAIVPLIPSGFCLFLRRPLATDGELLSRNP